ncbi:hypothetical protein LRQ11_05720 [Pseudomonas sp. MAFF 311095]|uniref:Lipoprotein n=1 Tax=Pseudomonas petroselini TaxID=2899822 RepID=A0ABS8QWP4_9PSED|nr:hypothetical protein [Pseudomonas petroselini]MCD7040165.1 hypothetical protein [Pseudomonas petroselini]MCD7045870.1 hypothetical protein [Pseudomonas petroselini]MCD7070525.1 hypothetical protein [Pseudomonas petroselini]MCD7078438.1 hypothetical protein [Pseudomonas petroselini]
MKATLLVLSAFLLLYGCATPLTSDMSSPSIADTKTVVFGGKTFVLKFQKPGLWEYFPAEESIDAWNEMVDFTVVPREMNRFKPLDLAKRAIQLHQQENPNMPAILLTDNKTGIDYSMMFYPMSLRKDGQFSEISYFKYYKDGTTGQTIIFHFARNIPRPSDPSESAIETGREIVPLIEAFPLYRP